ncbi:hypothetical protein V6Z11_D02G173600 [Gossypium hirsutum]
MRSGEILRILATMKLSTHCWDNFLLQTCWKMTAWKKRRRRFTPG